MEMWFLVVTVCLSKMGSFFCRDVDKIQDIMEDIAEQQDVSREISEAISTSIGFGQDYDEDELEKELEELEQEELDKELLSVNANSHPLPEVPVGDIKEPIISSKDKKGIFNLNKQLN